jgi:hypothetical protein
MTAHLKASSWRARVLRALEFVGSNLVNGEPVDLGGSTNLNLLVVGEDPYVIRVYRPWTTKRRILGLREVRRRLGSIGVQVPVPTVGSHGDVFRIAGCWSETEQYLPHVPMSVEQYPRSFAALGKLHRGMRQCWDGSIPDPRFPNYGSASQLLKWLQASTASVQGDASACNLAVRVASAIRQLGELEEEVQSLPRLPVHGDYTLVNIGFVTNDETAYFDFDVAGVRPRLHDVAYAALTMLRSVGGSVDPTQSSWEIVWRMVDEYEHTAPFPLTRTERHALPLEMARVSLCFAARVGFASTTGRHSPVHAAWEDAQRLLAVVGERRDA